MQEKDMCSFIRFMSFLSKKWVLVIIKSISDGCKSYSEIEKSLVGVNPRILSNRLKDLQEIGLVEKKIVEKKPLKCIYCLTKKGQSLSKHINKLSQWIEINFNCKSR